MKSYRTYVLFGFFFSFEVLQEQKLWGLYKIFSFKNWLFEKL